MGSEDTNINLLRLHPREILHDISLDLIHTIQGHVSSVKALSCSQSSDKSLLFSGGARASLKVWSISVSEQGKFRVYRSIIVMRKMSFRRGC